MAETIHVRGEGGTVIPMDLPLPDDIQDRLIKGYLRRVNADGSPYIEPAEQADGGSDLTNGVSPRPAQSAAKPEWVGYAVLVGGMTPDDADAMTKNELIERFGKD